MDLVISIAHESWKLFFESAIFMLFGVAVAGLTRVFLPPHFVHQHLGSGRFASVFKAALIGVPLPLCSCGVIPAAEGLRRQGASRGATVAFLITTPESGVDSIAASFAMLDPILAIARPIAALVTGCVAGIAEIITGPREDSRRHEPQLNCPVDNCCDGADCPPEVHANHHGFGERFSAGLQFAAFDMWAELAGSFFAGILIAGAVSALLPPDLLTRYVGGGLFSMLIMLAVGLPMYICATGSTPIAAALIAKGVSPGAALVFLLAGPATNLASITMLTKMIGRRSAISYLLSIAVISILCGLAVDQIYATLNINAAAIVGETSEAIPLWLRWTGAVTLIALTLWPQAKAWARRLPGRK